MEDTNVVPSVELPKTNYKLFVLGILFALAVAGAIYIGIKKPFGFVGKSYSEVYTLVPDKISQSAAVLISLPKGVPKEGAEKLVSFIPALQGTWTSAGNQANVIAFVPNDPLSIGKRFTATLTTTEGSLSKDFVIDEDPKVLEVFPRKDSEADADSSITIMFNRPMVPLTTLSTLEAQDLQVSLTPATDGKFKWISTRVLQFIPKTTLHYSSKYSVKILPGFQSTDGVPVPPAEFTFTTKALRFEGATSGNIVYNQPIELHFNQPVDIGRTIQGLTIKNVKTGALEAFEAEYGKRFDYDEKGKPKQVVIDRSVLSIFAKADSNGRSRVWDFGASYGLSLRNAYPLEGDIAYSGVINADVTVTEAIKSYIFASERTDLASSDLFDPQGKIVVDFYEDISLSKSDISAEGLKGVQYGKMCKPDGFPVWMNTDEEKCEKIDNKSQLVLQFNASTVGLGETFDVVFKKIVNDDGLIINSKPLTQKVVAYPELKILSISPDSGGQAGSLTEMNICTNSPLVTKDKKDYKQAITSSDYLVFNRWESPYLRVVNPYNSDAPCKPGEYVNTIRYGLHPEKPYSISLNLEDDFGQKISRTVKFTTAKPPAFYTRFYNLQKVYNVTTPDKTKLTYATENLDYVDLFVCKVAPATLLSYLNDRPSSTDPDSVLRCTDSRTDKISILGEYWVNNYFQIDIKKYFADPRGQYVISFSSPNYKQDSGRGSDSTQLYDRTFVSVTNLVVGEKKTQWTKYDQFPEDTKSAVKTAGTYSNLYWVSNANTLAPIADASVRLYVQPGDYNSLISAGPVGATGENGIASLPLTKDIVGAVVSAGADSAIISSWTDNLQWASYASSYRKQYVYTDRPIYRPGQDVNIKGIYRLQFDGVNQFSKGTNIHVNVSNPKDEVVLSVDVPLTDFGTYVTHLKLPAEAVLGTYRMEAGGDYWSGSFEVAEYQGAAFEAKAVSDKEEYVAGDTATVDVSGTYYFGVPLAGGKLQYSWTAQDFYFDRYTDEYFNFGAGWYSCAYCGYGDSYIGNGETTLDMTGRAKVSQTFDFKKLFTDDSGKKSKIIVLHGTVQDLNGKSVSFQKSFIVHRGDFYLGSKTDPYFAGIDQKVTVRAKTVDTQGASLSINNITLKASKVEWKSAKRQEVDGGYYSNYERVLTTVTTRSFGTGSDGNASVELSFKEPGEYEISLESSDKRGNQVVSVSSLYIYGSGTASVQPKNNETLDVSAEKTAVKVGDKAKIIIKSPYNQAKALVTVDRGGIYKYEVVTIDRNFYEYLVPIEDSYAPNVTVSVLLFSYNQDVKYGQVSLDVDTGKKELKVDVLSDKKYYLPGEKVNLTVKATDSDGRPEVAEISVAVADLSVLALKGNPKKNPISFFYGGLPVTVTTASNFKNKLTEAEIPTGTKGGDGGNPADLAKRKRGEFKDTAFWEGKVVTGEDGLAKVSFTLPDNLTRWQIESVGVTKDTKVGVNYREFTASKSVMAIPLAPRFILPGDEFTIGANVFNQTAEAQPLTVSFESGSLSIVGSAKQSINLKAGESTTVFFKVSAPLAFQSGSHKFVISAKNGNYEDTVERVIPVKKNETYESVATAGSTDSSMATEYIYIPEGVLSDRGGVTLRAQASLAFFIKDSLSYLAQFPYGCSEQMASKLDMLALLKKYNSSKVLGNKIEYPSIEFDGTTYTIDAAIEKGLTRLYENQTSEGGFSYYQGLDADVALTTHIIGVMADLNEAGFDIDEGSLSRASNFVANKLVASGSLYYLQNQAEIDSLIFSAYNLSRVPSRPYGLDQLIGIIRTRATPAYLSDRISSGALATFAMLTQMEPSLSTQESVVWNVLNNRVDTDSRGAYLKSNPSNQAWQYYETPVKNTGLFIKAVAMSEKSNPQLENMLRWLLASRDKTGAWGSTNATLSVIDGVLSYLNWSKEGESSFNLSVKLDDTPVAEHSFKGTSIADILEKFIPVGTFTQNKNHRLTIEKSSSIGAGKFYYDLGLTYYLPVEELPPRDEGISISRSYYSLLDTNGDKPLSEAKVGDVVRGHIRIITPKPRNLFAIEDFIPAGFELIDFTLDTEDKSVIDSMQNQNGKGSVGFANDAISGVLGSMPFADNFMSAVAVNAFTDTSLPQIYEEDLSRKERVQMLYPDFKELHDDRLFLFNQNLTAGEYIYDYYARVTTSGTFRVLPAVASELYFPEIFGRTEGGVFTVKQ